MPQDFYCAHCEDEFVIEASDEKPACPTCGQTEPVQPVDTFALMGDIRRQWYIVFAVLFLAAIGFAIYQWSATGS